MPSAKPPNGSNGRDRTDRVGFPSECPEPTVPICFASEIVTSRAVVTPDGAIHQLFNTI